MMMCCQVSCFYLSVPGLRAYPQLDLVCVNTLLIDLDYIQIIFLTRTFRAG